jgi:hypothetical protein
MILLGRWAEPNDSPARHLTNILSSLSHHSIAFLMQIHPTLLLLLIETFKIFVTPPFRNSSDILTSRDSLIVNGQRKLSLQGAKRKSNPKQNRDFRTFWPAMTAAVFTSFVIIPNDRPVMIPKWGRDSGGLLFLNPSPYHRFQQLRDLFISS